MRTKIAVMGAVVAALASLGMLSPREGVYASKTSQPDTRYVVFHKPGPKWVPGVDFRNQPGVGEHIVHYKRLWEDRKLELGGPFLDGSGGMMIPVAGAPREEIERFAQQDPAVKSGLLVYEIRPWLVAMKQP